ncbi:replication protein, partial [Fusobacterium nucleatum YWH7199]|nr:replication protein [Fusobacterium nucleatum YWH7199]
MAIIKIIKRDCPYVTIDKTGVDDSNLSWAATGLLTYLIGRPGNWKINITHLSSIKTCKETATKSALKELREANYCHYFVVRKNGKISETFYLVFEVPTNYEEVLENYIDLKEGETILYQPVKIGKNTENKTKKKAPQVENQLMGKNIENKEVIPQVENPLVENLIAENQGLLIKDTTNNRITNNKTTTSENKKSSSSLKENSLEKETINELLKKYSLSKITRKNILSLYSKKLITKERIMEVFEISKEKKWGEGAIYKALKE